MRRLTMMKSKIHRARVTHADLHYEGSVSIDVDLLEAADILPFESVHIWNVTQGTRLVTYALPAPRGSGVICINGAAAHLNQPEDLVILCTYLELDEEQARKHSGLCVRVDENNRIISCEAEIPGPAMPKAVV